MSSPNQGRRQPRLAELPQEERRLQATVTIQKAIREFKRKNQLSKFGKPAYETLRVYHGTHEENAEGILQQGLIAQGGPGLSGLIGDSRESRGKVFYTKDKQQAAYYARTLSSVKQYDKELAAKRAQDWDAFDDARESPVKPTLVRALVPVHLQQQAERDPKGGDQDFTIRQTVPPSLLLPGHEQPDADISQRRAAVTLFQVQLNKSGVGASWQEAAVTLKRMRSNSIGSDQSALDSNYAVEGADAHLATHRYKNLF